MPHQIIRNWHSDINEWGITIIHRKKYMGHQKLRQAQLDGYVYYECDTV